MAVSDGLHQTKSPLQALWTFGKLHQRQISEKGAGVMAVAGSARTRQDR